MNEGKSDPVSLNPVPPGFVEKFNAKAAMIRAIKMAEQAGDYKTMGELVIALSQM